MTVFARRRLQSMLNELAPILNDGKGKDVVQRLNDRKNVDQALPAEMEIALLWAINSLGDLEVEPEWWGDSKRPDAITDALIEGSTIAIEIAAPTDNAISGEQEMDAIALQISAAAHRARKGMGDYLRYYFREESGYIGGKYVRRRLAPQNFKIDDAMADLVSEWIRSGRSSDDRLRLYAPGLDVEVEHVAYKQIRFHNIFSSMPAETHSVDENPLYGLLRRKKRQLKAAAPGTL